MKILSAEQVKEADAYTIEQEPISGLALMERATASLLDELVQIFPDKETPFRIFAGPGNNGGDAITLARFLPQKGYANIKLYLCPGPPKTDDAKQALGKYRFAGPEWLENPEKLASFSRQTVIVDGLFGVGIDRPLEGYFEALVQELNSQECRKVSIDIPSGLASEPADWQRGASVFHADYTLTFNAPKLSQLLPETGNPVGKLLCCDIGLHPGYLDQASSEHYYTTLKQAKALLKSRPKFGHKGQFGRAQLVAGSKGSMGAAILSAKGALRSGLGLLYLQVPEVGLDVVQVGIPEAQAIAEGDSYSRDLVYREHINAIGIGPGLGQHYDSGLVLQKALLRKIPLVIDADGLNLLAKHEELQADLHDQVILTPHVGELRRLVGEADSHLGYLTKALYLARGTQATVVVKGAHTAVVSPSGEIAFNSTGNPGMATGGSGDVLTGVILSLLSQGYPVQDAARLGVFLHGLAGDIALEEMAEEAIIASDILDGLKAAWSRVRR